MTKRDGDGLTEMPKLRKGLADRLKEAMSATQTSSKSLGEAIGYSESGVKKWRSGASDPGFSQIALAAEFMGVSLDWLAFGTGEMWAGNPAAALVDVRKAAIDAKRLGLVMKEVEALFPAETDALDRTKAAVRIYEELWDLEDEAEFRGGLHVALNALRRNLRDR